MAFRPLICAQPSSRTHFMASGWFVVKRNIFPSVKDEVQPNSCHLLTHSKFGQFIKVVWAQHFFQMRSSSCCLAANFHGVRGIFHCAKFNHVKRLCLQSLLDIKQNGEPSFFHFVTDDCIKWGQKNDGHLKRMMMSSRRFTTFALLLVTLSGQIGVIIVDGQIAV